MTNKDLHSKQTDSSLHKSNKVKKNLLKISLNSLARKLEMKISFHPRFLKRTLERVKYYPRSHQPLK